LIGFEDLGSDANRQRQFSTKKTIEMDAWRANTLPNNTFLLGEKT